MKPENWIVVGAVSVTLALGLLLWKSQAHGPSGLQATISNNTGLFFVNASGGTPYGQFILYGISVATQAKYQLMSNVTTFDASGSATTQVTFGIIPPGQYTLQITDVSSGTNATGNTFTI